MSKPIVVSLPHGLGQQEALRRIKSGLAGVRQKYGAIISVDEESWLDNRLTLRLRAVGQSAEAVVDVENDHVRIEVMLPWLLAKVAEKFVPTIEHEATLMLENKSSSS